MVLYTRSTVGRLLIYSSLARTHRPTADSVMYSQCDTRPTSAEYTGVGAGIPKHRNA